MEIIGHIDFQMNAASLAPSRSAPTATAATDAAVLSKAVVRAARLLGLTQRDVAAALGISEATTSRLFAGRYVLSPERAKEWELALLVVRLFRSLDALWGHEASARLWLDSHNNALGDRPLRLLRTVEGLVRVVACLDAARGRL
jgi:transcriptional regulator with XRE-family HTH domain